MLEARSGPGDGIGGNLGAVDAAGLPQDVLDVVGDCVEVDHELCGNVLIALGVGNRAEHFQFAGSEAVWNGRRSVGDRLFADGRSDAEEFACSSMAGFPRRFTFDQQMVVAIQGHQFGPGDQ